MFTSEWLLKKHTYDDHNQPRPFPCDRCPSAFIKKTHLREHTIIHLKEDLQERSEVELQDEGQVRKTSAEGDKTRENDERKRPTTRNCKRNGSRAPGVSSISVACRFCSEKFSSTEACLAHEVEHAKLGSFPCRFCDKSFAMLRQRRRHEISHGVGGKIYECSDCKQQFSTK